MVDELEMRTRSAIANLMRAQRERVAGLARATEALSPLNVLHRGYSLTHAVEDNRPITSAAEVAVGQQVVTILDQGRITCRVAE